MRRRLSIAVLALAGAALCSAAAAQQPASKDRLVGSWSLVKWWNVADDGHEMPPPIEGENMRGLLMFDASGHFSLVIASDRPKWKSVDRMDGSPEENTAAARGTLAYFGTFSIDGPGQLTLRVERSLHPNISGTDQKRYISLSGDELRMNSPPFKYPKGTFTGYFIWRREK